MQRKPKQTGDGTFINAIISAIRDIRQAQAPEVNPLLKRFFQSPEQAIGPVIYLCCAEPAGNATGIYLHMMQRKSVAPAAADPENGARLWEASEALVAKARESL